MHTRGSFDFTTQTQTCEECERGTGGVRERKNTRKKKIIKDRGKGVTVKARTQLNNLEEAFAV